MTPPGAGIGAKEWKWALGLAGIALVLRVVSAADYLDDWDSVDFALALRRYSVVEMRPHFPGYPVYIWLASAAQTLVGDVPRALTYTSALAGGLTVWPVLLLARRLLPLRAALLAACLFLFSPLHWLTSAKALSDATGALFVIAFLAAALAARQSPEAAGRRRNEVVSSLCLGLALGARLSYFPFLITWFGLWLFPRERIHLRARLRHLGWSAAALALPVACWTLWQVGQEGAAPLIGEGLRFAGGHMLSWGRSLLTDPQPWLRPLRFLGDLWADGLGMWLPGAGPWRLLPTALLLAALAGGVWSGGARPRHRGLLSAEAPDRGAPPLDVPFLVLWVAPYGLWLLSGQNPEKPRHLLPFLPLATMGVAALIERAMEGLSPTHPPRRLAAAFGAAATLLVAPVALEAGRLVYEHRRAQPPAAQLARYLAERHEAAHTLVVAGEDKRVINYYAPDYTVRRARDVESFRDLVRQHRCYAHTVYVTSAATAGWPPSQREELARHLQPVRTFGRNSNSRRGHHFTVLYRLELATPWAQCRP